MSQAARDAGGAPEWWKQFLAARSAMRELEIEGKKGGEKESPRQGLPEAAADGPREPAAVGRFFAARNKLAEHYVMLVRHVAERLRTRLPQGVELEDLMAEGMFGLMEALGGFDETRGIKFETFAPRRVRGAILDYLRSIDWVPRLVRSRWREVQAVAGAFAKRHGRQPTDEEIIDRLDAPMPGRIFADGHVVTMNSIVRYDRDRGGDFTEGSFADHIGDDRVENPLTTVHRRQVKEYLLEKLTRFERLIVILNYYEGLTLAEIGRVLDISESRVSQIRSSILERLRARLDKAETTRLMTPEPAMR